MLKYLKQIWNSKDLRKKILFTVAVLVFYRFIAHITVPGANLDALKAMGDRNDLLQVFSLLTGGSTETFSIVLMGIGPYINASIIIQLLTVVIPKLENLKKEGEAGRQKINSYTRWLTFPLAFLQSYGMIILLNTQTPVPIIEGFDQASIVLPVMLSISAGTILLVWLGEQITEKGIGNGISLLIFASIISQVPQMIGQGLFLASEDESKVLPFIMVTLLAVILTTVVILVNEAQRRVPITYAGRGVRAKSDQAFLPMRINQAGMIPIIFAVALISFPGILGTFLKTATSPWLANLGSTMETLFLPSTITYLVAFYLLIVGFTYFYISITFDPKQVAENIQKRGGYIPGIRPGTQTTDYLAEISSKLTFFGSNFLALIAIVPMLITYMFSSSGIGNVPMLISGAGIIIIVGVVLELIRQVNAQLVMHDYKKFY